MNITNDLEVIFSTIQKEDKGNNPDIFKNKNASDETAKVETLFPESEYIKKERARAIEKLGKNWVLHPEYVPQDRHSVYPAVWWDNRILQYPLQRYGVPTVQSLDQDQYFQRMSPDYVKAFKAWVRNQDSQMST